MPSLAVLVAVATGLFCQLPPAPAVEDSDAGLTGSSLIANGDFETPNDHGDWPAGWPTADGATWERDEDGARFLRLTSVRPRHMTMLYRAIDLPDGVEALELSWRQRVSDLQTGANDWNDARIIMHLQDADGERLSPQPPHPATGRSTGGWQDRSVQFLVPAGAATLEFMPCLLEAEHGVFDLDQVRLVVIEPTPLLEARAARIREQTEAVPDPEPDRRDRWPLQLRVEGNRLLDTGGNEVWLQGVNVASLEWTARGENVLRSIRVAIEDWNANVIRLPVNEDYWFAEAGPAYKKLIDGAVAAAANRGAWVVLDLHRYRAPRERHAEFWREAAARYKDHPAVLFDLINEPHGISWEVWRDGGWVPERPAGADEDAFLDEAEQRRQRLGFESIGMQALLDAVRETGAGNLVVVGGLDWAYDLSGILEGFALRDHDHGRGIVYSTHVYPWKRGWQASFLDVAEVHPVLVGEVGADAVKMDFIPEEAQEDAETWVPAMLALIQQHRLHWAAWCFHPSAKPRMLLDWDYTPTPFWGEPARRALAGERFEPDQRGLR